ncbi:unnamed protein product [Parajaminaea phylloscopi]
MLAPLVRSAARPPSFSAARITRNRLFSASARTNMKIVPVPVRDDNYAYLVVDTPTKSGVFVDPYTLSKVQDAAKAEGVKGVLGCITTHHHHDHSGGNADFAKAYPDTKIWAGSDTPVMNELVKDGSSFDLGETITVRCHATPCHTQDSIAFYLEDKRSAADLPAGEVKRAVFTGDTLFISGCGRFFEGTAEEMHVALNRTLASLPEDTLVYQGHEYTKSNVAFSSGVLPDRPAIQALVKDLRDGRNGGVTAGVYTIADEKKHNVFMLVGDAEVQDKVGTKGQGEVATMQRLRDLKNNGQMMAKV